MHSASAINRGSADAAAEPLVDITVLRRIAEVLAAALRLRAQIEPLSPSRPARGSAGVAPRYSRA